MTTAAPWTCARCNTVNAAKLTGCSQCGTRRVVDLGRGAATTASATTTATATKPAKQPVPSTFTPPGPAFTTGGGSPAVATSTPSTTVTAAPSGVDHGVTRYLCCAVQLDAAFARRTVEQIVEEPRRAVASSPGVDLSCVLAYALAARRRQLSRDLALAALLILLLVGAGTSGSPLILLLGIVVAWAITVGELFYVYYQVIVPKLARNVFNPAAAPTPTSSYHTARLNEIARWDTGNVTVFQNFAPFAGYGQSVETWSLAIRTDVPKEGADKVKRFAVHALYDHVAAAVEKLHLPGVRVGDRLFVNGADLRVHLDDMTRLALLPDDEQAPASSVQPKLIRDLRADGAGRARAYLTLQVSGWQGELVSTQFLRFTLLPGQDVLFVENSTSLLAPVHAPYRSVDTMLDQPTFHQAATIISTALPRAISLLLAAIPSVLATVGHAFSRKDTLQLREIKHRSFNYGAPMSVREAASDHRYYRYYQKIDREMYAKVVSRRMLDSMIEFLEQHDIDTSDLRESQTTIYNHGLYVGANANVSVNRSAVAAGRNAVGRIFTPGARPGGGSTEGR